MKNKKGFTLVELLAVIVILAILLVIVVPKISDVITNARKGAFKSTNAMIVTELNRMNALEITPQTYTFTEGEVSPEIEITGELPTSGTIEVNELGQTQILTDNGTYCAIKRFDEDTVAVYDVGDVLCNIYSAITLTIDPNEGIYEETAENTIYQIFPFDTQELSVPTRVNYNFVDWDLSGTGNVEGNVYIAGLEDTILTANWSIWPTLTVNLNNGSTTQIFDIYYSPGTEITLTTPTRTDYTFVGWSVSGTGSSINSDVLTVGTANTILTANWHTTFTTDTYLYTDSVKTFVVPETGSYQIELWGTRAFSTGGKGSYTKGDVELTEGDILYVYIGSTSTLIATDVRYNSTSLNARIMVASPGAQNGTTTNGCSGGGLSGYTSNTPSGSGTSNGVASGGGSQTAGGTAGQLKCLYASTWQPYCNGGAGGFGTRGAASGNCGAGGTVAGVGSYGYWGGGGGGGCNNGSSIIVGGSGASGSSYISGHTGCIAIESSSSTTKRTGTSGATCTQGGTDNLCSIHYSGIYFYNTVMIDGYGYVWTNVKGSTTTMPNPTGGYYSSGGNTTNGYAKITYLDA